MNTLHNHNQARLEEIEASEVTLCRISATQCGIYEFKLSNGRTFYTGENGFKFFVEKLLK